jgi:peptide/nickel transport system permease protein
VVASREEGLPATPALAPARLDTEAPGQSYSLAHLLWRRFWRNRGAVTGFAIVAVVVLLALLAPWIAPYAPEKQFTARRLEGPSGDFWLGTDNLGRDVASRLLWGARPSIGLAALSTLVILTIGVTYGLWAGYIGGIVDDIAMRVVDVLEAFPTLILAIAIIGVLGPGLRGVMLAVISVVWTGYARLVRGYVLEVRERPFVQAAVALGCSRWQVILRHILPNVISPVIVLASLQMGFLLLTIAGLNFLGLGIQPPNPEWGAMLNAGRKFFQLAPQLMLYPGLMITVTVLGFSLLGDGLRDVLDPRHLDGH